MNIVKKISNFVVEVKQELAKVAWSSRKEIMGATTVVIVTTFMLALFIGAIDMFLSKILSVLFR
ncbi:MAG: preprotein translocase subunit SecE [Candidatus Omnitrophota bacterium]|nr:preprotein translocase subunit SecE [Candidatus Omnitrophota bacterium]